VAASDPAQPLPICGAGGSRDPGVVAAAGLVTLVPAARDQCRGQSGERSDGGPEDPIIFIDDLDGGDADGIVRFGLDGREYEIDLNGGHAQALRDVLAPYVRAARRVGGAARRAARGGRRAPGSGLSAAGVREWAKAQGIEVKDRGRGPAGLAVRFKAARSLPGLVRP
jgi:nucleoid-associated protein Lsr2